MYRILIAFVILFFATFAYAQETCPTNGQPLTDAQRVICQKELDDVNIQIAQQDAILKNQQQQTYSLARDVAILKAKIEKAKLDIKAKTILINGLSKDITQKQTVIGNLANKIDKEKESLGQLLRKTNEMEFYSLPEILLSQQDISFFFLDLDNFYSIQTSLKDSFAELKQAKNETNVQKQNLEVKKDSETDAKVAIETNKRNIEKNQAELNVLLGLSKTQEKNYQAVLNDKARRATEIRNALFALRDSVAIPFGKALEYANFASQKTGVRPAFLLAILTQESNLGKNVGSCYLTNQQTGEGVNTKTGKVFPNVMKPTRDVGPFIEITKALGLDPFKATVSCPIVSTTYWNSGSMGPAQFLPSTWKLFINRLKNILGYVANPWEPKDAFLASAMYLSDLGGIGESTSAQSKAACRYNTGSQISTCSYSRSVMKLAIKIQGTIDELD
ncbi:MAG: hypothetical protein AAB866_01585 [Patescibacteria group bacterium]